MLGTLRFAQPTRLLTIKTFETRQAQWGVSLHGIYKAGKVLLRKRYNYLHIDMKSTRWSNISTLL